MTRLRSKLPGGCSMFTGLWHVNKAGRLETILRESRTGNYTKLAACIRGLLTAKLDLATCAPIDLEAIHGIGPKTSRFFILWTRPGAEYAALDVHVLRWLRLMGHDAPKATPTGAKYAELERVFLVLAKSFGMTPRELDHAIWIEGSNYVGAVQAQP
jgi:thermostable 8-oxoguanine DNA glycosylase